MKSPNFVIVVQVIVALLASAAYYFFVARLGSSVWLEATLFSIGSLLGLALLVLDQKVFAARYAEQGVQKKIVMTRSLLFVMALIPLGIFLLTSSGSAMGMGVYFSLFSSILLEMLFLGGDTNSFNATFLSQLKVAVSAEQVQLYRGGLLFFWLYLVLQLFVF